MSDAASIPAGGNLESFEAQARLKRRRYLMGLRDRLQTDVRHLERLPDSGATRAAIDAKRQQVDALNAVLRGES